MKLDKALKIIAVSLAAIIGSVSLVSCSIPGSSKNNAKSTPTAAQAEPTKSPEELIVGKWEVKSISDQNGEDVNLSDVDLSGTPLSDYANVIGMILKTGVTIEFKADKTIPLIVTSGKYEIDGSRLKISVPDMSSQSVTADFNINGNSMELNISGYTLNLIKE